MNFNKNIELKKFIFNNFINRKYKTKLKKYIYNMYNLHLKEIYYKKNKIHYNKI
jgi:hypothetical protein